MATWEIMPLKKGTGIGLYIRTADKGEEISYHLFRKITDKMAEYLVANKLANDLHGLFDKPRGN